MSKILINELLEHNKKLNNIKNNIEENLNRIFNNPNMAEIKKLENLYDDYILLVSPSIDNKDNFFQNKYNVKMCSTKIKLGVSFDIEYLKK